MSIAQVEALVINDLFITKVGSDKLYKLMSWRSTCCFEDIVQTLRHRITSRYSVTQVTCVCVGCKEIEHSEATSSISCSFPSIVGTLRTHVGLPSLDHCTNWTEWYDYGLICLCSCLLLYWNTTLHTPSWHYLIGKTLWWMLWRSYYGITLMGTELDQDNRRHVKVCATNNNKFILHSLWFCIWLMLGVATF